MEVQNNPTNSNSNSSRAENTEEETVVETGTLTDEITTDAADEHLIHQVLGIPLILKEILKHVIFKDLLRTSLVSKSWNLFSREVLRQRNCIAYVLTHYNTCGSLLRLNKLLANTENVPFNGLSVCFDPAFIAHDCPVHENLLDFSCHILSKISNKFLELVYVNGRRTTCVAVDIIRKILGERAESLETLSLDQVTANAHTLARPILKRKLVPALKNFHYHPPPEHRETREWVREFAMTHPKLSSFCFSTHILKFGQILDEKISAWAEADKIDVARNLMRLLQSSKDRLVRFDADQLSLILMMSQWDIPVMRRVQTLGIWHSAFLEINSNLPTLSKVNFSQIFPNLTEVFIFNISFPRSTNHGFYLNETFRQNDTQSCCNTVRKFKVKGYHDGLEHHERFDVRQLQNFGRIFPNVKEFIVEDTNQFAELAEINYLLENVEDYETLEIVPVKPSLLILPILKCMEFTLKHPRKRCDQFQFPSDLKFAFLSRLTWHFAFARMPELKVSFRRETCPVSNCFLALDHLKEFVELTY
ncbi:unnamed protein product, partial [Allacma fusca]